MTPFNGVSTPITTPSNQKSNLFLSETLKNRLPGEIRLPGERQIVSPLSQDYLIIQ